MGLGARQIEEAGIPTVVVGSARDIVEECGVPRFLFVDFPLGNPCGKPDDVAMQRAITGLALDLLENAFAPRTTIQAPVVWDDDQGWRERYMHVGDDNRDQLAAAGAERRRIHEEVKAQRAAATGSTDSARVKEEAG